MLTDLPVGVLAEVATRIDQDDLLDMTSFGTACQATRAAALYAIRHWTCDLAVLAKDYLQAHDAWSTRTAADAQQKKVLEPLARMASGMRNCEAVDVIAPGDLEIDPTTNLFRDRFFNHSILELTHLVLQSVLPKLPALKELLLPALMPSSRLAQVLDAVGACRALQRLSLGLLDTQLLELQAALDTGRLPHLSEVCLEVGLPQRPSTDIGLWEYTTPLPTAPSLTSLTLQLHAWEHPSWPVEIPAQLRCRLSLPTSAPHPPLATLRILVLRSTNPPVDLDLSPLPPLPTLTTVDLTLDSLTPPSLLYLSRQRALSTLRLRARIDYSFPLSLDLTPLLPLPCLTHLSLEDIELTRPFPLPPTLTSLSATHVTGCFTASDFTHLSSLKSLSLMDITLPDNPLLWHHHPLPPAPFPAPPLPPTLLLTTLTSLELCALPLPQPLPPLPALRSLTLYCIYPHTSAIFASILAQPSLSSLSLYHRFPRTRTYSLDSSPLTYLSHLPTLTALRLFECDPRHLPLLPTLTSLRISKHISHPRTAPTFIAARYPLLADLALPATYTPLRCHHPSLPRPSPWLRNTAPLATLSHLTSLHLMAVEGEYPETTPDRAYVCRLAARARRTLPPTIRITATLDDFVYPSDSMFRPHRPPALPALAARVAGAARSFLRRLRRAASASFSGCYKSS